uniref:Chemokine interleukin-8-like domain-containing protein n=1 Tax=Terrapene triunguis TaxID=2587831 RepID=A0A674J7T0_9SAUR
MDGTQVSESRPDAGRARAGGMGRTQGVGLSPPPRAGAPMAGELRCQCLQTETAVIPPKRIANVELIPEGPHCGVPEVIATTKQGKKVCLEPTAPWVKLIVTKILNRYLPGGCSGCSQR